jgi:hypothetical protein
MKKAVCMMAVLIGGTFIGALLESCSSVADKDDCSYDYSSQKFFDVQGVTLGSTHLATNQVLTAGEAVPFTDLELDVQLQTRYYSFQRRHSSWLSAAYACPPAPMPGHGGTTERLDSLVIKCVFAYDATHPAGASLNDLLVDRDNVKALPDAPEPGSQPSLYSLRLRLRQGPAQAGTQQFILRYRLTNGEIYTASTPTVELR